MVLPFIGTEGNFTLFDSAFITQLSSHANELHPKQRASMELLGRRQVAQFCAEAVNEIHPSLHFTGQFQLSQIWM